MYAVNSNKSSSILFALSILKNPNNLMENQKNRIAAIHQQNNSADNIPSFLLKTYEILENEKYNDIISWTRNSEGFIVKKVKEFSQNVLPIYFRHSNYTSFVRQLNMYDFHKTRQENHQNAFKNVMFKRGSKHLLKDIQRKDYKKNKDNKDGTVERNTMEKHKDFSKIDKNYELSNNLSRLNLNKMIQLNTTLEKKVISLAEIRELPTKNADLLRLLDTLFEAKKIHKEVVDKLEFLSTNSKESADQPTSKFISLQTECEKECPTTEGKVSAFELVGKQQRQLSTNCFLSFNQI